MILKNNWQASQDRNVFIKSEYRILSTNQVVFDRKSLINNNRLFKMVNKIVKLRHYFFVKTSRAQVIKHTKNWQKNIVKIRNSETIPRSNINRICKKNRENKKFFFSWKHPVNKYKTSLVTQPMLQLRPNRSDPRSMDLSDQILCRFQKCKRKVPPSLPPFEKKHVV